MKEKYNIMYLSECNDMGGAEHSLYRLMKCCVSDGHNVYLVSPPHGKLKDLALGLGVNHISYDFPALNNINKFVLVKNIIRFLVYFLIILSRKNIDILHSNTIRTRFYLFFISKINKKIKTIAHIRDIQKNPYQDTLLKNIDYTIAISQAVYDSLNVKNNNFNKVKIIHNGVEDLKNEIINKEFIDNRNNFKIGIVGRIESWKRQDLFVDAALDLLYRRKDCEFYIVGDCIKKEHLEYKSKVVTLINNNPNIHLVGHVDNPFDYMNMLDIIVCPSENEPFGRVVIEAMSLGKPVIGSDSGGIIEIITTNIDKQLFSCGNKNELIDKIEFILNNEPLIKELGESNYINYKSRFSIENNFKKTIEVYDL
ncbi:glycosyltransferase family 4 protein [Vibrio crassostreae]|uniref:glycosyltransferase family 4 protein n=1 Tax=Vibrio crassostreae TaxID=246167 RepID=UPI000F46ACBA|nr:glycosyltransferase family 4 protein [Vibrio crassostreae]ROP20133.1 glycosyltransferase involved in cell wall biosynthesis [Vibrio crassostreae]ROP21776.1 glycosyltransferase involved in cell wall biosynthesis [Vibrio crassostreae]RPE97614.1 glycosyltransferase involved in cell wall biosynthesis [Vibrio crassostreae]RPE99920.1 glycosyltransferase involved in cell wall biosynthesis [Vibrio crassostreae]TCN70910.1 glycosyltransferase involved in cell wall biosynthesis [Vibrio crassostreae]